MLNKIKNVVKGNLYYWNTVHNSAVTDIYNRFNKLDKNEKEIAEYVIAVCSSLIGQIMGPDRKKFTTTNLSDQEMKKVTLEQHCGILIISFEMFARLTSLSTNPKFNRLAKIDKKIFGENYHLEQEKFQKNKESIKRLIKLYSEEIAVKSSIIDPEDPTYFYSFFELSQEYFSGIKTFLLNEK